VNPVDAAAYLETGQLPGGSTGPVTPGVALTPAEMAAEQSRATAWLAQIPGAPSGGQDRLANECSDCCGSSGRSAQTIFHMSQRISGSR
jgi:hypothetical protein